MPKVKRRLREEERKMIRSGQVFVFDERESGIKRWTDGLVWSPSRILWNFLVYRQVDKKFGGRNSANKSAEVSPESIESELRENDLQSYDPYALGVSAAMPHTSASISISESHLGEANSSVKQETGTRNRSTSSTSETIPTWSTKEVSEASLLRPGSLPSQRNLEEERNLVGSLKSSYPFAKGGLCKKTISIQIDGSTQHLISYYSVDDVRSGRLRTPSSLPEIASLSISPTLLTKTFFRFPPTVHYGPDGVPRFRGEDGIKVENGSNLTESSGEGHSSGGESRPNTYRNESLVRKDQYPQAHLLAAPRSSAMIGAGMQMSPGLVKVRLAPMSHQIGGSGAYQPGQQQYSSSRRRLEPYSREGRGQRSGGGGGGSSISTSPSSLPSTPFMISDNALRGARQDLLDPSNQMNLDFESTTLGRNNSEDLGGYAQDRSSTDSGLLITGMTLNSDEGINPYQHEEEEEERSNFMEEFLAEQMSSRGAQGLWNSTDAQQELLRRRVLGDVAKETVRCASPEDIKPIVSITANTLPFDYTSLHDSGAMDARMGPQQHTKSGSPVSYPSWPDHEHMPQHLQGSYFVASQQHQQALHSKPMIHSFSVEQEGMKRSPFQQSHSQHHPDWSSQLNPLTSSQQQQFYTTGAPVRTALSQSTLNRTASSSPSYLLAAGKSFVQHPSRVV